MSDHKKVNRSEDHELNYILKKLDKRQTAENRKVLKDLETDYINLKDSKPISDKENLYKYLNGRKKFQDLD